MKTMPQNGPLFGPCVGNSSTESSPNGISPHYESMLWIDAACAAHILESRNRMLIADRTRDWSRPHIRMAALACT